MAGTPAGFDADTVRAGLRVAMEFGLPSSVSDQPTFFMPGSTSTTDEVDADGIPFDPTASITVTPGDSHRVDCAVEYVDAPGKVENFGVLVPSEVKLTFLDSDYSVIAGFETCVIAGQRYYYMRTEPPVALGTVDIYTVHCRAEDDG